MLVRVFVNGDRIVEGHITGDGSIILDIVKHRCASSPEDHRLRIWVSRGHSMGEIELGGIQRGSPSIALVHLMDGYPETRMMVGWTAVVEVSTPRSGDGPCEGEKCE